MRPNYIISMYSRSGKTKQTKIFVHTYFRNKRRKKISQQVRGGFQEYLGRSQIILHNSLRVSGSKIRTSKMEWMTSFWYSTHGLRENQIQGIWGELQQKENQGYYKLLQIIYNTIPNKYFFKILNLRLKYYTNIRSNYTYHIFQQVD